MGLAALSKSSDLVWFECMPRRASNLLFVFYPRSFATEKLELDTAPARQPGFGLPCISRVTHLGPEEDYILTGLLLRNLN